jgi:hypothetical protein
MFGLFKRHPPTILLAGFGNSHVIPAHGRCASSLKPGRA